MNHLIEHISNLIKEIEVSLGLDWRFSYLSVTRARGGGGAVGLSSKEVFDALRERLGDIPIEPMPHGLFRAGTEENGVTVQLIQPPAERRLWTMSSVADVRREPSHAAELVSQLIMGESAGALGLEGDWYLALLEDGYHGWIRSWYVRDAGAEEIASYRARINAQVGANIAYIRESPDGGSIPVSDLTAGTRIVAALAAGGYRRVLLPGGREGFAPERDLEELTEPPVTQRDRIIGRAKRFIGINYLWGGATSKGFDCSGLVKRVFMMEGVELPRDSDRQALVGDPVGLDAALPGDLLFFGEGEPITHVAIYLGERRFIHAYGEVRINSLAADDPLFDPKLAGILRAVRRVIA
jgi:hypothetical protein